MSSETPNGTQRRRFILSALTAGLSAPAALPALSQTFDDFGLENPEKGEVSDPTLKENQMQITFIHRPLKKGEAPAMPPKGTPRPPSVVGIPKYGLSVRDGMFIVDMKVERYGRTYEGTARIPILPGIYVSLRYEADPGRVTLVNMRHSGYENNNEKETESSFYFGRVLITATGIYASLNGRHSDLPGVENFERLPEENSEAALKRASPEARLMIEQIEERNRILTHVDILDYVLYLEAQVDFLTKVVLDQNLVKPSPCLDLLKYADSQAAYRFEKEPALKNLFTAKMQMRQAQHLARIEIKDEEGGE